MSTEVAKSNRYPDLGNNGGAAAPHNAWREMLGYDPFRRFFTNLDPQIDVIRSEQGFEVEIPVAGFASGEIDITVKEDVLTVTGKNDRRAFTRSLRLPDDIDDQNIEASVEHGMLTLRLKRHPEAQPRRIEVKEKSS